MEQARATVNHMNHQRNSTQHMKKKVTKLLIAIGLTINSAAWGTWCYCSIDDNNTSCGQNQTASLGNGCIGKTAVPSVTSYCDSRDGVPGQVECTVRNV